jgi:hypothetical protein
LRAQRGPKFDKCAKHRFYKGFCDINIFSTKLLCASARRFGSAEVASWRRRKSAKSPLKKKLENLREQASRFAGFGANRANRLQVIRARRRLR